MTQLHTNVSDIKAVAKNLAKKLKMMKFDISHSSALNLASSSLGFKDYQTYKALSEKDISKDSNFTAKSLAQIIEETNQQNIEDYPSIDKNFVKFLD